MVGEVRLYIEGDDSLRLGFHDFLGSLREAARRRRIRWNMVLSGSRENTFEDFKTGLDEHPAAFHVLLVDAEAPVGGPPWEHLRKHDHWAVASVGDVQCQLMVQSMETLLVADVDALRRYYGQEFRHKALPGGRDLEQIDKPTILAALGAATRNTTKGRYHKTRHAGHLLRLLDVARVRRACRHCDRLFTTLEAKIKEA